MNSKPFLLLYIIGLSIIVYWTYPIIIERYFSNEEKSEIISSQIDCEGDEVCEVNLETASNKEGENKNNNEESEDMLGNVESSNAFLEIGRNDCDSECAYFEIENEKKYCLQVCGLSTSTAPTSDGCETLDGLEKDYCWKNEAVEKTDFLICKKINDSKIKGVCQNRVTEDIIDSQKIEN